MSLIETSHGWTLCKSAFGMQSVRVTAYWYAIIQWYSVLAYLQYTMDIYDSEWHFTEGTWMFHFDACFHLGPLQLRFGRNLLVTSRHKGISGQVGMRSI